MGCSQKSQVVLDLVKCRAEIRIVKVDRLAADFFRIKAVHEQARFGLEQPLIAGDFGVRIAEQKTFAPPGGGGFVTPALRVQSEPVIGRGAPALGRVLGNDPLKGFQSLARTATADQCHVIRDQKTREGCARRCGIIQQRLRKLRRLRRVARLQVGQKDQCHIAPPAIVIVPKPEFFPLWQPLPESQRLSGMPKIINLPTGQQLS